MTPPERPPVDPVTAARQRDATSAEDRSHWWSIAAMSSQFLLGGIAGAWAAQIADDGSEMAPSMARYQGLQTQRSGFAAQGVPRSTTHPGVPCPQSAEERLNHGSMQRQRACPRTSGATWIGRVWES